jgi:hypothetical protein
MGGLSRGAMTMMCDMNPWKKTKSEGSRKVGWVESVALDRWEGLSG